MRQISIKIADLLPGDRRTREILNKETHGELRVEVSVEARPGTDFAVKWFGGYATQREVGSASTK